MITFTSLCEIYEPQLTDPTNLGGENTLRSLMTKPLPYSNQSVWVLPLNGKFLLDSPYQIGHRPNDDWLLFDSCRGIEDYISYYIDSAEGNDYRWRSQAMILLTYDINVEQGFSPPILPRLELPQ